MTMTMLSGRTAILCRVSTLRQAEEEATSLNNQERYCREAAADLGLTVSERHVAMVVESASQVGHHPQLERLFAQAERGDFST